VLLRSSLKLCFKAIQMHYDCEVSWFLASPKPGEKQHPAGYPEPPNWKVRTVPVDQSYFVFIFFYILNTSILGIHKSKNK
jgi:hypothetical protein